MKTKRIFIVGLICLFMYFALIARLAYIQLIGTESFSGRKINLIRASIDQRMEKVVLDDGRGKLLDRNGKPLRRSVTPGIILFPFLKEEDWPSRQLARILGTNPAKLRKAVNSSISPFVFLRNLSKHQVKLIRKLHIPGVYAGPVQSKTRDSFAQHLIGFVAENPKLIRQRYPDALRTHQLKLGTKIGVSGLEEAFDPFLISGTPEELVSYSAANGKPMFGHRLRYKGAENPFYPLNVRTTLDTNMQRIVERAVDQAGVVKGGAVLLDAENSNLLAMVSRPLYDSNAPYRYGGKNYMILPQIPGSVFKVVTAAAAIEKNSVDPDRLYDCNRTLYGKKGASRQLGKLSFLQSFAQSCNRTFALTATELIKEDRQYIENYADKLGLIGPVGWTGKVDNQFHIRQFPNEEAGSIWENRSYKNNTKSVAQTAIGQLSVRISPLAVANEMATIARGGTKLEVRAATEVDYANGVKMTDFPARKLGGGKISRFTAMQLQKYLSKVVDSPKGTGHRLSHLPYDVAGKSGTAETGNHTDNHWFAGYFPASHPRYVLAVVDLDSRSGSKKTYEVYKQVVKGLYNLDTSESARS